MLNLPKNTKAIYAYDEKISFPVFIYVRDEWEETQVAYLNHNYDCADFTTLTLCKWCENHNIFYQVIYPSNLFKLMFRDFNRFLCFLYLKKEGY